MSENRPKMGGGAIIIAIVLVAVAVMAKSGDLIKLINPPSKVAKVVKATSGELISPPSSILRTKGEGLINSPSEVVKATGGDYGLADRVADRVFCVEPSWARQACKRFFLHCERNNSSIDACRREWEKCETQCENKNAKAQEVCLEQCANQPMTREELRNFLRTPTIGIGASEPQKKKESESGVKGTRDELDELDRLNSGNE